MKFRKSPKLGHLFNVNHFFFTWNNSRALKRVPNPSFKIWKASNIYIDSLCLWRARSRPGCGRRATCSFPRPSGGRPTHLPPANLVPTSWTGTPALPWAARCLYSLTELRQKKITNSLDLTLQKFPYLDNLPVLVKKKFIVCLGPAEFYIWISVFFYP